jgi:RHS repeat-associated protein
VLAEDTGTQTRWMLADHQGSIRQIVDNTGSLLNQITYDSYGNITNQTNPSVTFRFSYTGREWDGETGQYFYRARYYDARVGRFLSTDPIGFTAGDANLYRYVGNSPINATDPSGMLSSAQQVALLTIAMHGTRELSYPRPAHAPTHTCDFPPDKFAAARDASDKLSSLFPIGIVSTGPGRLGSFGDDLARGADVADDLGRAGSRTFNPEPPSTRNILPPASPPNQKALPPVGGSSSPINNTPLGRGSTVNPAAGRFPARNIREQMAIQEAISNPTAGNPLRMRQPMNDSRWPSNQGWVKMSKIVNPGSNQIEVHYVRNTRTGEIDDFKIIAPK